MHKGVTVLVMEDAPLLRRLLARMLADLGAVTRILEAGDVASALSLLDEHRPEIAILDIEVPGSGALRNGIDVLKHMRRTHPGTPVIMLTNHDNPRYRAECLRAGAVEFFDKSDEFEKLAPTVSRLAQSQAA